MSTNQCSCTAQYFGLEAWRKQLWASVFDNGLVPIDGPTLTAVRLRHGPDAVYMLDKTRCTEDQLAAIARVLAEQFGASYEQTWHSIRHGLVPIRAQDIALNICRRHAWQVTL